MSKKLTQYWKYFAVGVSAILIIGILIIAGLFVFTPQQPTLTVAWKAAPFTLVNQDNQTVTLNSYLGKVLIISFIYTHCPNPNGTLGECSTITLKMNTMLTDLQNMGYNANQFHLLSISFDWKFDNVSTMKAYGQDRGEGQFNYWSFLSGNEQQVNNVTKGYYVTANYDNQTNSTTPVQTTPPPTDNQIEYMTHSEIVYLVDKQGNIRIAKDSQGTLQLVDGITWSASTVAQYVRQLINEK